MQEAYFIQAEIYYILIYFFCPSRRLARPERTSFPDGSDGSGSYSHPSSHEISLDFIVRFCEFLVRYITPKLKFFLIF